MHESSSWGRKWSNCRSKTIIWLFFCFASFFFLFLSPDSLNSTSHHARRLHSHDRARRASSCGGSSSRARSAQQRRRQRHRSRIGRGRSRRRSQQQPQRTRTAVGRLGRPSVRRDSRAVHHGTAGNATHDGRYSSNERVRRRQSVNNGAEADGSGASAPRAPQWPKQLPCSPSRLCFFPCPSLSYSLQWTACCTTCRS